MATITRSGPLEEILVRLRPKLAALEELKRARPVRPLSWAGATHSGPPSLRFDDHHGSFGWLMLRSPQSANAPASVSLSAIKTNDSNLAVSGFFEIRAEQADLQLGGIVEREVTKNTPRLLPSSSKLICWNISTRPSSRTRARICDLTTRSRARPTPRTRTQIKIPQIRRSESGERELATRIRRWTQIKRWGGLRLKLSRNPVPKVFKTLKLQPMVISVMPLIKATSQFILILSLSVFICVHLWLKNRVSCWPGHSSRHFRRATPSARALPHFLLAVLGGYRHRPKEPAISCGHHPAPLTSFMVK